MPVTLYNEKMIKVCGDQIFKNIQDMKVLYKKKKKQFEASSGIDRRILRKELKELENSYYFDLAFGLNVNE